MFDFKKIENIVAGIQAHMAEQKKQKELELLVNTATAICASNRVQTDIQEEHVTASIFIAQQIILKSKAAL